MGVKVDQQTFRQVKTALKERTQKQTREMFNLSHSTIERISAASSLKEYHLNNKLRMQKERAQKQSKTKQSFWRRIKLWA